jgi:hypothetical protein
MSPLHLALTTLALTLWLPACAHAHRDHHHHATPVASLTDSAAPWRAALEDFGRAGDPASLTVAREFEQAFVAAASRDGDLLYLAAWTAQADHRFAVAADRAAQLQSVRPRWASTHLLSAGLALVAGDRARAGQQCRRLEAVAVAVRLACQLQAQQPLSAQDYHRYRRALQPVQSQAAPAGAEASMGWIALVLGDAAVRAGLLEPAERQYRLALAAAPSVRARTALAATLLQQDRPAAVLDLIHAGTPALGLQVKRLVAARRLGRLADSMATVGELLRAFDAQAQAGDFTHGREMAEFHLHVRNAPEAALRAIRGSLELQREPEDLALWREAQLASATRQHTQLQLQPGVYSNAQG